MRGEARERDSAAGDVVCVMCLSAPLNAAPFPAGMQITRPRRIRSDSPHTSISCLFHELGGARARDSFVEGAN